MVLKPYFLRGVKTIFFHRKSEGPARKPYEKIAFSAFSATFNGLGLEVQARPCLQHEEEDIVEVFLQARQS